MAWHIAIENDYLSYHATTFQNYTNSILNTVIFIRTFFFSPYKLIEEIGCKTEIQEQSAVSVTRKQEYFSGIVEGDERDFYNFQDSSVKWDVIWP